MVVRPQAPTVDRSVTDYRKTPLHYDLGEHGQATRVFEGSLVLEPAALPAALGLAVEK
jgi:hypothetical protein